MALTIQWGNSLEALADDLLERWAVGRAATIEEVFGLRDAFVVPNRVQQAWLQQRFLCDGKSSRSPAPRVLAHCDFLLLNLFIGDWLYRMDHPEPMGLRPDPEKHPFSVKSLRWRIYDFLLSGNPGPEFAPLERYILHNGRPDPRKGFKLAGRLAALLDQYQTYRPEMVARWESGGDAGTTEWTAWQPALWRRLVRGSEDQTLLAAFRKMEVRLQESNIQQTYRRIFVFAPSMMPEVHLAFFRALGQLLPVTLYLFNPSREDWFDRDSLQAVIRRSAGMDGMENAEALLDFKHPLLSAYARGVRDLAAGAIELSGGQVEERFVGPKGDTVLARLQATLVECDAGMEALPGHRDHSIQIHQCHGKMREVEILHDQILHAFAGCSGLQPRHIQVQAADLNAYAPYIEAVFSCAPASGTPPIPFVMADRVAAGESTVATAFRQCLEFVDSRFAAPDVLALLRCPAVGMAFGLEPSDVEDAAGWLAQAGIRWGRNVAHRRQVSGADFEPQTTWSHGLERLLMGYALGREASGGWVEGRVPCDAVEGDGAVRLGRLAEVLERLEAMATYAAVSHPAAEWAHEIGQWVEDFFGGKDEAGTDTLVLKSALRLLAASTEMAGFKGNVPIAVVRDFLTGHLGDTAGGTSLNRNAVVFSSLRPGSSAPRRIQCLLGMGEGMFPRAEVRPAYDLMGQARRIGDRSAVVEDRMAFLEVLMNARERLLMLYPAFSEEDNAELGESVVIRELKEYVGARFGPAGIATIRHHVQACHPDYFRGEGDGLSFSLPDYEAALVRAAPATGREAEATATAADRVAAVGPPPREVALDDLEEWIRNPARFYFRHVAGASLVCSESGALDNTETFEPDPRELFRVRETVLQALRNQAELEPVRARLMSDGQIPLGNWGRQWFEAAVAEMHALLNHPLSGGTLRDGLRHRDEAPEEVLLAEVEAEGHTIRVEGRLRIFDLGGFPTTLVYRASTPTASVRVGAWMAHLLACAGGRPLQTIVAQGKHTKGFEVYRFGGIDPEAARVGLADGLGAFLAGRRMPLPFTPATAVAYAEKCLADPADAQAAWKAAKDKWTSGFVPAFDGDQDPYARAAFGPEGFFEPPLLDSFLEWARRIALPMVECQQKEKKGRRS